MAGTVRVVVLYVLEHPRRKAPITGIYPQASVGGQRPIASERRAWGILCVNVFEAKSNRPLSGQLPPPILCKFNERPPIHHLE